MKFLTKRSAFGDGYTLFASQSEGVSQLGKIEDILRKYKIEDLRQLSAHLKEIDTWLEDATYFIFLIESYKKFLHEKGLSKEANEFVKEEMRHKQ